MLRIGLTGGVGMGKSTAAQYLAKGNWPVVDTDDLARKVVEPGQPALEEVRQVFGPEILHPDGNLNRSELARLVFRNPSARKSLEKILHPKIREIWQSDLDRWQQEKRPAGIVVIPLLFETEAGPHFDLVLCAACTVRTQEQRLLQRGWTREQIQQRIQAQWDIRQKILHSDFLIWTEGTLEILSQQLDLIMAGAGLP